MFMVTLSRPGLKKLGAVTLCGVLLVGAVVGVSHWRSSSVSASAQPSSDKIETTQDIGTFFSARGFEVDLASASVDKVKIPRKWDDSFTAFNEVVQQSGMDLDKYKGKTVEKWLALCPARSKGEEKCYAVLLVHKQKPIGAYLLTKPSGEVTGLQAAAETSLPLDLNEMEASAQFGSEAEETQAEAQPAEETAAQPEAAETAAEPEAEAAETAAELESDEAALAAAGEAPVE